MKPYTTDAVCRLYREKYKSSAEKNPASGRCNVLKYSIGMSMLSLAFSTPGEPLQASLLRRVAGQMDELHDMECEDAFASGFQAAAELMAKEKRNHAA